jgi:HD-GYP domain-containing protein (c-di-GMP phosphodiesterase class II)
VTTRLLAGSDDGVRRTTVVVVSLAVLLLAERAARRLLPLPALLSLGLLFPYTAPRRLQLALRAGSTRELTRVRAGEGAAAEAAAQVLQLLASLARHDPGSRRHSERVRAYVDLLSEALRLPDGDRDRLRWAALVHDLGKTRVDPRILRKPERLDADEWRSVREHPAAGERLAAGLRTFLGPWFDGIGQHHERWDGRGYPAGLAGQRSPTPDASWPWPTPWRS